MQKRFYSKSVNKAEAQANLIVRNSKRIFVSFKVFLGFLKGFAIETYQQGKWKFLISIEPVQKIIRFLFVKVKFLLHQRLILWSRNSRIKTINHTNSYLSCFCRRLIGEKLFCKKTVSSSRVESWKVGVVTTLNYPWQLLPNRISLLKGPFISHHLEFLTNEQSLKKDIWILSGFLFGKTWFFRFETRASQGACSAQFCWSSFWQTHSTDSLDLTLILEK